MFYDISVGILCRLHFISNKQSAEICLFDVKWMRNKGDTKEN